MSKWRTIDSAPEDGTRILLYIPKRFTINTEIIVVGRWNGRDKRPYFSNDRERLLGLVLTRKNQPTHWMPLPEPPTDDTH